MELYPLGGNEPNVIQYTIPYQNIETITVDITKPLNIDTSMLIPQTENEQAVFDYAKKNQKFVATLSFSDDEIINKNGLVLVPLRVLAEFVGCEVSWDENLKAAYVSNATVTARFTIDSKQYTVNGVTYYLDTPAEIKSGKTYIPLRSAAEALGLQATYNNQSKTVTLSECNKN
jgi:hypothetical protein